VTSFKTSPGHLAGITFGHWLRVLAENHFEVSPSALPAAGVITGLSLFNSLMARVQDVYLLSARRRARAVEPPIFILGLPRSGTTMLQHLLAEDRRFHIPNLYQVRHPFTFLVTERWLPGLLSGRVSSTRGLDNVRLGWSVPDDDEFATALISLRSSLIGVAFPHRRDWYERFCSFENADPHDRQRYQDALRTYAGWLTAGDPRRIVFKSPLHTGRIRLFREVFPDAQFITIHRHPEDVFRSLRHTVSVLWPRWSLQDLPELDVDQFLLERYRESLELYFRDRAALPPGQLVEVAYQEMETQPLQAMEQIYHSLKLGGFEQAAPGFQRYLEALGDYRKNRHVPLPGDLQARLHDAWRLAYQEWGYSAAG
jgi:hypothetical protein